MPRAGGPAPLRCVAPLAAGRVDDPAALRGEIERWRAAGATAFHVGFSHRSADDLVDLLERFRHERRLVTRGIRGSRRVRATPALVRAGLERRQAG